MNNKIYNKREIVKEMVWNGANKDRCIRSLHGEHLKTRFIKGYKTVNGSLLPVMGVRCSQCGVILSEGE